MKQNYALEYSLQITGVLRTSHQNIKKNCREKKVYKSNSD
jgi:hypothetical protein